MLYPAPLIGIAVLIVVKLLIDVETSTSVAISAQGLFVKYFWRHCKWLWMSNIQTKKKRRNLLRNFGVLIEVYDSFLLCCRNSLHCNTLKGFKTGSRLLVWSDILQNGQ